MQPQSFSRAYRESTVLAAWPEGVAQAVQDPALEQQLVLQERELLPRFAEHYTKLKALLRRVRRGLQRQGRRSLAGIALLLALGQTPALAATINVGGACTLIRAPAFPAATIPCPTLAMRLDVPAFSRASTSNFRTRTAAKMAKLLEGISEETGYGGSTVLIKPRANSPTEQPLRGSQRTSGQRGQTTSLQPPRRLVLEARRPQRECGILSRILNCESVGAPNSAMHRSRYRGPAIFPIRRHEEAANPHSLVGADSHGMSGGMGRTRISE